MDPSLYRCSYCLSTFDQLTPFNYENLLLSCLALFPHDFCEELNVKHNGSAIYKHDSGIMSSRNRCTQLGFCPDENQELFMKTLTASDGLDVRISKALGSKGYDKVRVSIISNRSISDSTFTYSEQFKYRWTSMYLSTGIATIQPGTKTRLSVAGKNIDVLIPKEGDGTRGVIVADPCFTSQWITCVYKDKFSTFSHTIELINAINSFDDVHFFQILGDNFYDQAGDATASFFAGLTDVAKSKLFSTVPGNHDFWVNGTPKLWVPKDSQGNGFMQFYGQDTIASTTGTTPFDFSVDPDGAGKGSANLPVASNYFFYNKVGNIAFIGYSGAHSYDSMASYFVEACTWASSVNPDAVLLLGHWNSDGDGCSADTTTEAIYADIIQLPECAAVASKMRYFMGHTHCNLVTEKDVGFMVGAMGMNDFSCPAAYGIPVVDTTGGSFKVYYFPIYDQSSAVKPVDNYDATLSCIQANGVSNCYHLATLWSEKAF